MMLKTEAIKMIQEAPGDHVAVIMFDREWVALQVEIDTDDSLKVSDAVAELVLEDCADSLLRDEYGDNNDWWYEISESLEKYGIVVEGTVMTSGEAILLHYKKPCRRVSEVLAEMDMWPHPIPKIPKPIPPVFEQGSDIDRRSFAEEGW